GFQKLLVTYARADRTFLVAREATDTVYSELLLRDAGGKEYKPEDYLKAFSTWVKENEDQVAALRILLARPRDWSPQALTELRQKLTATPYRFTPANLERAHRL